MWVMNISPAITNNLLFLHAEVTGQLEYCVRIFPQQDQALVTA